MLQNRHRSSSPERSLSPRLVAQCTRLEDDSHLALTYIECLHTTTAFGRVICGHSLLYFFVELGAFPPKLV